MFRGEPVLHRDGDGVELDDPFRDGVQAREPVAGDHAAPWTK
jgi:hypothetical protein